MEKKARSEFYQHFPTSLWNRSKPVASLGKEIVNRCRRIYMPFLQWRSRNLYPDYGSRSIKRINDTLVIKSECFGSFGEANTLQFIRERTSIPVPRILDAWKTWKGETRMSIEWVPNSHTLESKWPSLDDQQKRYIAHQLRGFLDQLRAIPQPPDLEGHIGPLDGSPVCHRSVLAYPCGPFTSEKLFNDLLLSRVECFGWQEDVKKQIQFIRDNLHGNHRVVFTHGDLHDRNILIDDACNVVAIIDWEMAGWMPEYWEYTSGMSAGFEDWQLFVEQFMQPYDQELKIYDMFVTIYGCGLWTV